MSVYVTGDTHGGFQRLGMKYFPEQKKMNREDMVIIAGDFGGLWGGTPAEKYWLDWLEELSWVPARVLPPAPGARREYRTPAAARTTTRAAPRIKTERFFIKPP